MSHAANGRAEMFGELVARYQKPVFRLACSMLGNRSDAEDAAQEAFIRAYKSLSTYTESGRIWGWLRRITVNVCLNKARPVTMTSLDEVDEIPGLAGNDVYDTVVSSTQATELRRKINQLPLPYRSVIVLKYLEDMSYAEIAETLGETLSNIQVRIYRAKKMLRERTEACQDEMR
jgi:RNA polymerase sigma-70 factor (ECF subfamily)